MKTSNLLHLEASNLLSKCALFYDVHNFTLRASKVALRAHIFTSQQPPSHLESFDELVLELCENYKSIHNRFTGYSVENYFASLLFLDLISSVEVYLSNVIRLILKMYPKKIGETKFSLVDVIGRSVDELVTEASDKFIYSLMYKKPKEILTELGTVFSLDITPLQQDWNIFIEAKARRDVGVHNNWICNETYIRKVKESGVKVEYIAGQNILPTEQNYYAVVVSSIISFVEILNSLLIKKYPD